MTPAGSPAAGIAPRSVLPDAARSPLSLAAASSGETAATAPRGPADVVTDAAGSARSALAPTVRLARPEMDPGPMPPRWRREAHRYAHEDGGTWVLRPSGDRVLGLVDFGGAIAYAEVVVRDVADLLAWLRRGGR